MSATQQLDLDYRASNPAGTGRPVSCPTQQAVNFVGSVTPGGEILGTNGETEAASTSLVDPVSNTGGADASACAGSIPAGSQPRFDVGQSGSAADGLKLEGTRSASGFAQRGTVQVAASSGCESQCPTSSRAERFEEFHRSNPDVYRELVRMARELRAKGHERIGIRMLWEVCRWSRMLQIDRVGDYLMNDHFTAPIARLIMQQEQDLAGVFEIRGRR